MRACVLPIARIVVAGPRIARQLVPPGLDHVIDVIDVSEARMLGVPRAVPGEKNERRIGERKRESLCFLCERGSV